MGTCDSVWLICGRRTSIMSIVIVAAFALLVPACVADGGDFPNFGGYSQGGYQGPQGGYQGPQGAHAPPGYSNIHGHFNSYAHPGAYGGFFGTGALAGFLNFGLAAGSAVLMGSLMLLVIGLVLSGLANLLGGIAPVVHSVQDLFGARKLELVNLYNSGTFSNLSDMAYQVLKAINEGEEKEKQPQQ